MLCLVVALAAEARPLLASHRLQGVSGHPYRICTGEQTHLIVSGIGKVAAAAATAYLRALIGDTPAAWLNIGIAGHGSQAVGTPLLAHKVVDAASGKPFYPTFTAPPPCRTTLLHTVDRAQSPAGNAAYDMEASGFCEAAQRFATSERVHCLKVVSDNPPSPYQTLNAKKIEALIEAQLDTVAQAGEHLQTLSQQLHALHADPPGLAELTTHWQFTATQQHQLRGLLARWQTLAPTTAVISDDLLALQSRNEVLAYLQQRLDDVEFFLTPEEAKDDRAEA
ncbi:MAG: hypothetical protein J4F35_16940 [Candidatus Latescibacteria bacterium]|nr:hypothetical protein [Candidatus Latescibacterota bacterium]